MKKTLLLTAIALTLFAGCTPYGVAKKGQQEKTDEPVAETKYEPSGPVSYTFLDTINRGKEITLSNSDFEKGTSSSSNAAVYQNQASIYYKIQLFASSQIETVREQKREIENVIKLPLFISFESPYYKLLAGNFTQRTEAEEELKKIKKLGYTDAWIVSTKSIE